MRDLLSERETSNSGAPSARDARRLRIGVMGYYGYGNAGDEVILDNIRQMFAPCEIVPFDANFPATEADIERLNAYDFLILGGGGLYNQTPVSPFGTFDRWQHLLHSPIGVLGLGVERLTADYLVATHQLVDRAEFFVVRDAESRKLVNHPGVEVAPDLTFFRPFPVCDYPTSNLQPCAAVNLRPIGTQMGGWVEAVKALPCDKIAAPFSTVPTYDDRELLRLIDPACPDGFQPAVYQVADLFIGTALHSIMFAIQSGIPAIAICYHPKVRRIMEDVGLSDYLLRPDQASELFACYERLMLDRDRVRRQMLAYRALCRQEWEWRSVHIKRLIDQAANRAPRTPLPGNERPRVSVVIDASTKTSEEEVLRTVASCRAQIYFNLEILVLDEMKGVSGSSARTGSFRQVKPDLGTSSINASTSTSFAELTGDLIAWIQAGSWYAPDAIELLVRVSERHPLAIGAKADYYLTHEGIIERKITSDLGPFCCFLLTREGAADLREFTGPEIQAVACKLADRLIHVHHGLLFRPSTEYEHKLYRATILYGSRQIQEACNLLQEVLVSTVAMPHQQDIVFRAFLHAAFCSLITADPVDYLTRVADNLPSELAVAGHFGRAFRGRVLVEAAFISHARGQIPTARRLLLRAFRADRHRLRHRGTLVFFLRTVLGDSTMTRFRRAKSFLRHLRPWARASTRLQEGE